MTLPLFISSRQENYQAASRWAIRMKSFKGNDKRLAQKAIVKHLLAAIGTKK